MYFLAHQQLADSHVERAGAERVAHSVGRPGNRQRNTGRMDEVWTGNHGSDEWRAE